MRWRIPALAALWMAFFCAVISAQTPPLGAEFQINTFTPGGQYGYGIGADRAGNFVVAWQSDLQDGSGYGVFARRFDPAGIPQGTEFQANTYTTADQGYPTIGVAPGGGFVVVWQSYLQDGSLGGVFGQRFDKTGARQGAEFPINTYTTADQELPVVATDTGGNFVVVWQSNGQDGAGFGIFGQRFDNAGTPVGGEFQVNSYTTGDQVNPVVAMSGSGSFVVAWDGQGPTAADAIFARRFDDAGVPQGPEFQVDAGLSPAYPAVGMDGSGGFVVAWQGPTAGGSLKDAVARRFDATGAALGSEFRVNTYTTGDQFSPSVAVDPDGNFIISWESPGEDGSGDGVFGQWFDRDGNLVGSEFPINSYTTGSQQLPRVAASGRGDFVVEFNSVGQDGSSYGVFGRRSALSAAASFQVDAHASSGSSDVNGVLEPGETVLVEPAWKNASASSQTFTGSAPDITGPPGATYSITDGTADYGTVAAGSSANCHDASGDCYEISVSNPATRPATHWDVKLQEDLSLATPKTWTLHVGHSFSDVPETQPFYKKIEALFHSGVTTGCTATTYCPGDTVSRSQMSLFVARGIAGSGAAIPSKGNVGANAYNCTSGGVSLFTDVAPTDIECKSVHYIAAQNVTLGCSPTTYCPADTVTRIQMAAFVAKAVVAPGGGAAVPVTYGPDPVTGFSYSCNTGSPNVHFTDVPATDSFCKHVHYLWAKGIITGCGATTYCPGDSVTRDAMAKFLDNGFNLQLYGP